MRTPPVLRALVLVSTAMIAPVATATGDIITYTFSGQGSGTLGSSTFTDAFYSVVLTGKTENVIVQSCGFGIPFIFGNCRLPASIFITGLGTYTFTGLPMAVFASIDNRGTGLVGTHSNGEHDYYFDRDLVLEFGVPGMANYRLASNFGPVTGTSWQSFPTSELATSGGTQRLNATSNVTFQSVIVTPEPATIVLVATGILAMVGVASRRNKSPSEQTSRVRQV